MKEVLLRSEEQSLELLNRFIEEMLEQHPKFRILQANMVSVLSEAVNNAIVHGNKHDPQKKVYCSYVIDGSVVRFRVEDEGSGFEYSKVPSPLAVDNIEKPHGRGIFIIRMLSDKVTFEKEGRLLIIEFDINKSEQMLSMARHAD